MTDISLVVSLFEVGLILALQITTQSLAIEHEDSQLSIGSAKNVNTAFESVYTSFVQIDLQGLNKKMNTCGGTIISSQHILTSALCLGDQAELSGVIISNRKPRPTDKRLKIEKICRHEKFNYVKKEQHLEYDIAVIKLASELNFNSTVRSSTLNRKPISKGDNIIAIGIGLKDFSKLGYPMSKHLQAVQVKLVECEQKHESNICFVNPYSKGTKCLAKDGSGLFKNVDGEAVLVAVASGVDRAHKTCKKPSVNTNIYVVHEDIEKLMKDCS